MPFRIKFGRTRHHYNVASKTLFVIAIEILDNSNIECTLECDTIGQECLTNVCRKLNINQPEYFGLQFESRICQQTRHTSFDWLDLCLPVKKQLDKFAKSMLLRLRVLYFVSSGVRLITCDQTRYQYFQQLKHDVLEGRLICTPAVAAQLASYAMQAEFGDYNPERHTASYLKEFCLFPKTFCEPEFLQCLTEAAIQQHSSLLGVPSSTGEELYITACQQLTDYGQETYICKYQETQTVTIGISLKGFRIIFDEDNIVFYRWIDITNVLSSKKHLIIECPKFDGTERFLFVDADSAKAACKMCILQYKFFTDCEQELQKDNNNTLNAFNSHQSVTNHLSNNLNVNNRVYNNNACDYYNLNEEQIQGENVRGDTNIYILPKYRAAPDYETAIKLKKIQMSLLAQSNVHSTKQPPQPDIIQNELCNPRNQSQLHPLVVNGNQELVHSYYNQMNRFNSTSTPDLPTLHRVPKNLFVPPVSNEYQFQLKPKSNHIQNKFQNGSSPDLVSSFLSSNYHLVQSNHDHDRNQREILMNHNGKHNEIVKFTPVRSLSSYLPLTYGTFENLSTILNEEQEHRKSSIVRDGQNADCDDHQVLNSEPIYENIPHSTTSNNNLVTKSNRNQNRIGKGRAIQNGNCVESTNKVVEYNNVMLSNDHNCVGGKHVNENGTKMLNTSQASSSSSKSSNKKKRWHLLPSNKTLLNAGKFISEKSATLGREAKHHIDTSDHQKHRWSSSGLGKLQNNVISKEILCEMLESKLSENQLFLEFDQIPKSKSNANFATAQLNENLQLNRFKDVLPYEDNRVRLTSSRDNKYGYVNASHITVSVGQKQMFYIAAQGPSNDQQLSVFWQCVWEAEVYLIIQLNLEIEDMDYLPNCKNNCKEVGQYQICWEFSQESGHCATSKIRLCHIVSRRYRTIWHLKYQNWDENGCPKSVGDYLGFLEEVRYVRQYSLDEIPQGHNRNPPVLVHCTAGVGRTGMTILSDLLLFATDHNHEVDIARIVYLLRHQRAFMVQTVSQYRFVYLLLIHYIKQTRLI